jgi:tetratricopeptide (TPR) repeat protein
MSCKRDGILITNGDNDTFPLWALQEAYGIRRDVRIVNLSLINTKWYIRQMKNLEPKVPITFSEAKIDALDHEANPLAEAIPYTLNSAGITIRLPGRKDMNAWRIQDKMVLHMVDVNRWRKPIYFAVTVSNDNMMGMQEYLQMQGMVYEIQPKPVPADKRIDLDRTEFLLDKVYRYRGLGSSNRPLNETTEKLLTNYAAGFIQMAIGLRGPLASLKDETAKLELAAADTLAPKDTLESRRAVLSAKKAEYEAMLIRTVSKLDQCVSLMPWDWRPRALRHEILLAHGRYEEALEKIRQARKIEPDNIDYMKMEAQILEKTGKEAEAADLIRQLSKLESDPWESIVYLCSQYEKTGMWDSAISVMEEYGQMHPGDRRAAAMKTRYNAMKKAALNAIAAESAKAAQG